MTNSQNLNSADYYVYSNLSMIAYIIEIQKSKYANILFCGFEWSEPGRLMKFCAFCGIIPMLRAVEESVTDIPVICSDISSHFLD